MMKDHPSDPFLKMRQGAFLETGSISGVHIFGDKVHGCLRPPHLWCLRGVNLNLFLEFLDEPLAGCLGSSASSTLVVPQGCKLKSIFGRGTGALVALVLVRLGGHVRQLSPAGSLLARLPALHPNSASSSSSALTSSSLWWWSSSSLEMVFSLLLS